MYTRRFYRDRVGRDERDRFELAIGESDLLIRCDHGLRDLAHAALTEARREIEGHIVRHPGFTTALVPSAADPGAGSLIREMAAAAEAWGVGPMAAVAGVVAEAVAERLLSRSGSVSVENGGDVYVRAPGPVTFLLYASEDSPFSDSVTFEVDASDGVGVCTSSGRVGPSLSFGQADAVVAIADRAAQADAAATALANRIGTPDDIAPLMEEAAGWAVAGEGAEAGAGRAGSLKGLLACCGDRLGIWGGITLVDRQAPCHGSGTNRQELTEEGTIS